MENRSKRLLSNSFWNFVGNAGSKIIGFLLLPFYTKWLGTEGYGFSDLVTTYSSLFGGIVTLCLSDAILIFVKGKDVGEQKSFFSSAIISAFVLFFIWCLIAFILKIYYPGNSFVLNNIGFILGMIITNFLQTSSHQMTLALDKIRIYSFTGIVQCISIFVFSWLLIPRYGIVGYVYAMIIANLTTTCYSVFTTGSLHFLSGYAIKKDSIEQLVRYAVPLIPNVIMWWLVSALNRPLMESHLGLSAVGIYAVAQKFPGIVTLLFSVFSVSWTVSVVEEYDKPEFEAFFTKVFRIVFCALVLCTIMLMLLSDTIIDLLTAPEFHESYKYMVLLMIGAVFSCMSAFWGTSFSVIKKTKYFFYSSVWGAVVAILLNYLLIPKLQIYGAAISVVLSFFVMAITRYVYNNKFIKSRTLGRAFLYAVFLIINALTAIFLKGFLVRLFVAMTSITMLLIVDRDLIKSMMELLGKRLTISER